VTHSLWFHENFEVSKGRQLSIAIKSHLISKKSKYQNIDIYETVSFGKMLTLDGVIMLTEFDNFAYHEMMTHVPMQSHINPKKALVIGGGDGGILKELLKYSSLEEIWICEIDKEVIEVSKDFFPKLAKSFDNKKVNLYVGDGAIFMKENKNKFDIVCVDSSDPIGPAEVLFTKSFYQDIKNALSKNGIASTQSESMYYHSSFINKLYEQNKEIFSYCNYYFTVIPTYPSGTIGFSFCSNKFDPFENLDKSRIEKLNDLLYYNYDIHKASFVLPEFAKKAIKKEG
jgi:spermidine synthase